MREVYQSPDLYYLHGDHLGTATYVTDANGETTQFFLNLPFGETMAEQMTGVYENPYKFNAKEIDHETGFYYYGARYYNPKWSLWYGVDPLAEKMPSWSPYVYTFNNPIIFTDPDGREPYPPRWGNLVVQVDWTNRHTTFENWDGNASLRGQIGYLKANDLKTKLEVIYVQSTYGSSVVPDSNGNYTNKWERLIDIHPGQKQNLQTNCYGWVLTGGLYYVNGSTQEVANYLVADGYKNMGTPSKNTNYKVGDLLLWDGHIIEATKKGKNGLIWESKQGTGSVESGTLQEILNINSSTNPEQGTVSKSNLFRAPANSKDLIMNKNREPIGTVKKVTNEDHQKINKN